MGRSDVYDAGDRFFLFSTWNVKNVFCPLSCGVKNYRSLEEAGRRINWPSNYNKLLDI
jgi:hypothetical protein